MKSFLSWMTALIKKCQYDEVISLANELAFKIVLSMFPFIIFLMSVLGFLNIDGTVLIVGLKDYVPIQILNIVQLFVTEVLEQRHVTLLSTSLLIALYNASSGVRAIIRGINKSYGHKETRNFLIVMGISILLMLMLVFSIILSLVVLIYGDSLTRLLSHYISLDQHQVEFLNFISYLVVLLLLIVMVMAIYKLGNCKKLKWLNVLPGALITVFLWLVISKLFNLYVNNFANYSKIYGSIGNIYILLIWLNIISIVLLVGSEINALLEEI